MTTQAEWLPIDQAPKDGQPLALCRRPAPEGMRRSAFFTGHWSSAHQQWRGYACDYVPPYEVTHFARLAALAHLPSLP